LINSICNQALLAAYERRAAAVSVEMIEDVASRFRLDGGAATATELSQVHTFAAREELQPVISLAYAAAAGSSERGAQTSRDWKHSQEHDAAGRPVPDTRPAPAGRTEDAQVRRADAAHTPTFTVDPGMQAPRWLQRLLKPQQRRRVRRPAHE